MTGLLEGVADVSTLRVEPGDVVVVRIADPPTLAAVIAVREQVAKLWPDNQVVVGAGVLELEAVRLELISDEGRAAVDWIRARRQTACDQLGNGGKNYAWSGRDLAAVAVLLRAVGVQP